VLSKIEKLYSEKSKAEELYLCLVLSPEDHLQHLQEKPELVLHVNMMSYLWMAWQVATTNWC